MSKPRILMCTNVYPSEATPEVGSFVRNSFLALQRCMPEVEIVLVRKQFHEGRAGTLLSYLAFLARLYSHLAGRCDLVYAHMVFPTGWLCLPFPMLGRAPLIAYAHGGDVVGANKREMHQWSKPGRFGILRRVKALTRTTLERAARVHTCSAFLQAETVRTFGTDPGKFLVASMGIDTERFQPAASGIPGDRRTLLFVGRMTWQKGFDLYLALADALQRESPGKYRFLCVGRCNDAAYLARVSEAGFEHINGMDQAGLPDVYRSAFATVMPSRYEAFGLVAVESLSCGTPVLAMDTGGLKGIVEPGNNGFLFGDAEGLLKRFRDLEGDYAAIQARCRGSVQRFAIEREMAAIAEDCRRTMMARSGAKGPG